MADLPITVKLVEAVTHGKETHTQLTFDHYVTGADLIASDAMQGGMRRDMALYASLAKVPFQVIVAMRGSDFLKVKEATAPILGEYFQVKTVAEENPTDLAPSGES